LSISARSMTFTMRMLPIGNHLVTINQVSAH
jgi:hypothetical protein